MSLSRAQARAGAVAGPDGPLHFGDPVAELRAGLEGVGLVDLSGRGRLWVTGADRRAYLHRITAQSFQDLEPPGGVRAALLERTGKIVEVFTAHAFESHFLLLTSAANRERARDWLARFVFRDDVEVEDRTEATGQLLLTGPRAAEVASALAGRDLEGCSLHSWTPLPGEAAGGLIRADAGGWFAVSDAAVMPALWDSVLAAGRAADLRPVGSKAWSALRVLSGLPEGGAELGAASNPLEMGLDDSVDLAKGCFTGQEALSKMLTYGAVKRRLIGLELGEGEPPDPGSPLSPLSSTSAVSSVSSDSSRSRQVGRVTSVAIVPGEARAVALALVSVDHAEIGGRLEVGDGPGTAVVRPLPFPA